ncbi:ABC transporter ATP-binding protein [Nocardioides cavernaquae]|uniref:ABC-type quaternary amine transporter n=1 Tax=Nocardioides cavernaquae TaxID=2321396 RepID=A0A3A5H874_9ACTN|nr:ABC transporter ATP-binding protein [Nocardioides cavernaquae]RJS46068.1 ABC transporter ATP-binding protein [Nocardioides cavernaquae]
MLELSDVSVRYAGVPALADVSLSLVAGEVLAVLGPSGCGKSTLLRAIAGLEPLTSGAVRWDGHDLAGVPTHRRGFALLFQDGQLFAHRSVGANVAYPLRLRRQPRAAVAARVEELLALVGLSGYADRSPATLSGGERQRVALARALATSPRLLLLDEPLSALDQVLRERLAGDLRSILRAAGTTALLVTHDHEEAFSVADRMALLRAGRLIQHGTLDEVWAHPADAEAAAFLGYATVLRGDAARFLLESSAQVAASATSPRTRLAGQEIAVALRRSALRVDATGPLEGRVIEARLTPELSRLMVDVAGLGVLPAVAGGSRAEAPVPGEWVRIVIDPSRLAVVPVA